VEPAKEEVKSVATNIPEEPKETKSSSWIGKGLGVLGGAAIGLGMYKNYQMNNYYKEATNLKEKGKIGKGSYTKAQDAESMRNIYYAAGGALLLGGVVVYIWF